MSAGSLQELECARCGITPADLPDGVGFEDEWIVADFFAGGVCGACR